MKLQEFIRKLQEASDIKEYDYPLVYSRDDEGNGFQHVYYAPTLGFYDGEDFVPMEAAVENALEHGSGDPKDFYADWEQVICIN